MKYTKELFKKTWEVDIEDFTFKLEYPFDQYSVKLCPPHKNNKSNLEKILSAVPEESMNQSNPLISYNEYVDYNAPIGQSYNDYQYSYEEGYFKAFKLIVAGSYVDSESFLMPALFLARHYIELSLKDEIINMSIATGNNIHIGNKDNHNLITLSNSFKKLLDDNDLNILTSKFFNIVEAIAQLSPKSDEFRYTIDVNGKYNLPIDFNDNNEYPIVIDLITLAQYLNYIYLRLFSLFFILADNDESVFAPTPFMCPDIKGLLNGIVHSKISNKLNKSSKETIVNTIKECISSIISNNHLKIKSKHIRVIESDGYYQVLLCDQELFKLVKNDKSWYLKTQPLLD